MYPSRTLPFWALILVVLLAGTVQPVRAQSVGESAPDFTYTTLAGGELSLSDYEGQVVFIFFFGYACPFCLAVGNRTEAEVNAVYSSRSDFQAIGLDLWNGSAAGVDAFKATTGVTYPLCLQAGAAANLFGMTYDRVMVIDREGIIRFKGTSAVSSTLDDAIAVIDDLLSTPTGVEDETPTRFALEQNYPNPFNPSTTISFSIPQAESVRLGVYDMLGRLVETLADGPLPAGRHTVTWNAAEASSGVYFYRLQTSSHTDVKRMTLSR